jgi:deoxyribose-phosphate aldolase
MVLSSDQLIDRIVQEKLEKATLSTVKSSQSLNHNHNPSQALTAQSVAVSSYNPDAVLACGADRVSCTLGLLDQVRQEIARMIDHTLLKADASGDQVRLICQEAAKHHFASVCINPCWVSLATRMLKDTTVKVCTVIGFPLGANHSKTKAYEARLAVREGADEVDMVLNVGAALDGDWARVETDIRSVVEAVDRKTVTKVILETCLLNDEQIVKSSLMARKAGADFVKTSTGFSSGGATPEHVALMRRVVGAGMGVKASGGVRSLNDAVGMIESGADRLGASASVAIVGGRDTAVTGGY